LSFEYEQAPVFFGRTRSRNELRELLACQIDRGTAFLLVFGASGSGKSSLVKAGLLPDLSLSGMIGRVALVRRALLRPSDAGGDPLAALAAAIMSVTALPELSALQYTPETLAALLRDAPGQAALPIRQGLAAAGKAVQPPLTNIAEARLNVVVDQLEELFTIERVGQPAREAFVAALEALARSGLVWVVATMRSDFFDRLETLPALAAVSAEARFLLLPPDPAEIGQIIRQPALEAGLRFEVDTHGVGLDERIRQAAAGERGALPLLSFLLDQLWQRRSEQGLLTFAAYAELGGSRRRDRPPCRGGVPGPTGGGAEGTRAAVARAGDDGRRQACLPRRAAVALSRRLAAPATTRRLARSRGAPPGRGDSLSRGAGEGNERGRLGRGTGADCARGIGDRLDASARPDRHRRTRPRIARAARTGSCPVAGGAAPGKERTCDWRIVLDRGARSGGALGAELPGELTDFVSPPRGARTSWTPLVFPASILWYDYMSLWL
jgi:hypothetical protein